MWEATNRGLNRNILGCIFFPCSCSYVVRVKRSAMLALSASLLLLLPPQLRPGRRLCYFRTARCFSLLIFYFFSLSWCACALIQHHVVPGLVSACTRRGQGKDWICHSTSTLVRLRPWPAPAPHHHHPSPPPLRPCWHPQATRARRTHTGSLMEAGP